MKTPQKNITAYGIFAALAVLLIPFHAINIGGRGILLYISVPLLFTALLRMMSNRDRLTVTPLQLSMLLFLLYYFFAALWAPEPSVSVMYNFLKVAVFAVCVAFGQYSEKEKKRILWAAFISGVIVCGMLLWAPTVLVENSQRVTVSIFGTSYDPNYMSYSLLIPTLICLSGVMSKKSLILKALFIAIILAVLYGSISTGSRGGAIAIAAVILIYLLYWGRIRRGRKIILFIAIIALTFAAQRMIEAMPEEIAIRFTYVKIARSGGGGRLSIWNRVFPLIFASPLRFLFGYGSGSSVWLLGIATHNHLLQIWLENGFIGVLLFLMFLFQLFRHVLHRGNGFAFAALVGAVVLSMSLSVQTIAQYWSVIAVCVALGEYQPFQEKEARQALAEENPKPEESDKEITP